MRTRIPLLLAIWFGLLTHQAVGFDFYPGTSYDPSIPTLKQVMGYDWGEDITDPRGIETYMAALAKASPRVQLVKYGETWEKRPLHYIVVSSQANIGRVAQIQEGLQKLARPDRLSSGEADRLLKSLPVCVWLGYGVHGNEISSPEAALLTVYHLVAAKDDPLAQLALENAVVIVDPLQNPDGRERFVSYFRQTRGRWPDESQEAAEHNEPWPGGRSNHYLFDMNRDWFALTQPETQGRVKAYLSWFPQVFVDLHEMGADSTYYFAPPAPPLNPEFTSEQNHWLVQFGKNNAAWFDKMHFDYFTREVFDSFYPGYGEGWPMFHGSIGMTFEQASTRGLLVRKEDETLLHYREAIQHHFIASLATVETAAKNRLELLKYFHATRQGAIESGRKGPVLEYIIDPQRNPSRAAKLAANLIAQGVEVKRAEEPFKNSKVKDFYGDSLQAREFPAGSYVVSLAQPAKPLASTLLSRHTVIEADFIKEQERRRKKRLDDEFYDITAWSLPLLYDVDCFAAEEETKARLEILAAAPRYQGKVIGGKATLAYLIPWTGDSSARALSRLLAEDVRVYSAGKSFVQRATSFPAGTLIVKVNGNPDKLHDLMGQVSSECGVDIYSTDTGWVDQGINFGSGHVQYVKKPKVLLAYNTPTSSASAGALRFLLEQVYAVPVTIVHAQGLRNARLQKYDVLVLPDSRAGYSAIFGDEAVRRLKDWISAGGTLVTMGEATRWLTEEKVDLLASSREFRGSSGEKRPAEPAKEPVDADGKAPEAQKQPPESRPFDLEKAIQPEKELPEVTPGAILRVKLDTEHWLAFGYDGDANVLVQSRNIFTPIKLDKGQNVGLYMPEDKLLLSGYSWPESTRQLAEKAYLIHQPLGSGHVVAFSEDPSFRAFCDGLHLLVLNAVFFGPAW